MWGVWRGGKARPSVGAGKAARGAAAMSNPALSTGCRSVVGAWSRTVGRLAVTVGRYRSKGGGAAGADSGVTTGSVISTPPGAWALAVTVPATWITVSSRRPPAGSPAPAGGRRTGPGRATWAP